MQSSEIQHKVQDIIDNLSKEEFIYDLLLAYGISKTSVTRLKKGDYNFSKIEGEILYKKKIFFKKEASEKLLSSIEDISKEERILKQKPRFAVLTDYKQIVAKDLKLGKNLDIPLKELPNYFDFFLPLAGSEVYNASNDNEADRNASYKMADLYDLLIEENPSIYNSKENIHNLNIFLSRLLFCFFAEDTDIFEQESIFTNSLAQHTAENGKDTHTFLDDLFDRLNTKDADLAEVPNYLTKFPYVNGGLFKEKINSPIFTPKARKTLIDLGELQWSEINPDIFGSMIQAVVDKDYRSDLGMHYTSVENILKLIKPLFLDELYEAYENATTINQLQKLINRIATIKFFDPACGSGNFLIITYKEIRLLEILILEKITDLEGQSPTIKWTSIQLSQFYGIEIDDFAHEMAILSLWLAEHQMNKVFEDRLSDYGKSKPILPLKEAGQIQQGNATREDWNEVCPISSKDEAYVIGNPPYLGYSRQDKDQKEDMSIVFSNVKSYKKLDYIACWFYKATEYIENTKAKYAFVTTNSITQGEQVALLWPLILNKGQEIDFAHQSFKWTNNAKRNAGVSVVIIGIRNISIAQKFLYNNNLKLSAKNISPYLTDTKNIIVTKRTKPISNLPIMMKGSQPTDGGNLLLSQKEKDNLIGNCSSSKRIIKPFVGTKEFIDGESKYCLWVNDNDLENISTCDEIKRRFDAVSIMRLNSTKSATNKLASSPHKFGEIRYFEKEVIIVPTITSERRNYFPCGILDK